MVVMVPSQLLAQVGKTANACADPLYPPHTHPLPHLHTHCLLLVPQGPSEALHTLVAIISDTVNDTVLCQPTWQGHIVAQEEVDSVLLLCICVGVAVEAPATMATNGNRSQHTHRVGVGGRQQCTPSAHHIQHV
jgi:hypothetical protein